MDMIRLLAADPNPQTRTVIREICAAENWVLDEALDGIQAIKLFRRNGYRFVFLNPALPELDGRNVLKQLRLISDVPIFLICDSLSSIGGANGGPAGASARTQPDLSEAQCMEYFQLGADDILLLPVSKGTLAARIKVFLRRTGTATRKEEPTLAYRGLYVDTFSHAVYVDENPVPLTPRQYALLAFLSRNPNRAFSREALLDEVWGEEFAGTGRTVDTHIKALRQQIEPYGHYLVTVWGFGYKFEAV